MIKIDIISGFLGACKTTLIKKLLRYCSDMNEKVVLIENEFGKIGIDGDLIRRDGFDVYEISEGCICCTLRSDFISILAEIIDKVKPDRVIFEPSGIFVLTEILDLLKAPEFVSKCFINSIITVVDCVNFFKQNGSFGYFFQNQLANADILILSKSQLTPEKTVEKITIELHKINHHAQIIATDWGHLTAQDIKELLYSENRVNLDELLHCSYCDDDHHNHHSHHTHNNHGFDTFSSAVSKEFTTEELDTLLDKLKRSEYGNIIRGKGFVKAQHGCLEFSYVNGDYTIVSNNTQFLNKICFIGINLRNRLLKEAFE